LLTTDPLYWKGYQPKIVIKDLGNTTTYYTFDPFSDVTTNKVIYARCDVGMDHHGTFEIQIEDKDLGLDTGNIKSGQRIFMSLKKDASLSYNLVLSGLIRKTGFTRGRGGEALYNMVGSSTALRLNEITTNVDVQADFLDDGVTLDITDTNFKADTLLQTRLAGLTTDGVITAANLATNSDVENFVPSLKVNFGELQDVCNIVEENSNAEVSVDTSDVVLLRHRVQPFVSGKGFVIKDIQGTQDDADITGYIDGTPEYWESFYKSDGYSNQLHGILPVQQVPDLKAHTFGTFASAFPNNESAWKFKPPHSVWLPGDVYILADYVNLDATPIDVDPKVRFRICTDNAGVPTNAGGIVANIEFNNGAFGHLPTSTEGATNAVASNDQEFFDSTNSIIPSFTLDTTKYYWIIMSDDNQPSSTQYHEWRSTGIGITSTNCMDHTTNMSSDSAGGSSWAYRNASGPLWFVGRTRSQAFECADPKAIKTLGSGLGTTGGNHITSTLSGMPSSITTREAIQRYLINQLYETARPQVRWTGLRISSPNTPILPNDPLLIVDSTLGFSSAGNPAHVLTTGDMSYQFGERGGDGNNLVSGMYLNIEPVGYATHY
jgi:hypothetical protein